MELLGGTLQPLEALVAALVELDEDRSISLAKEILSQDQSMSLPIVQACQQAMKVVGERYERHEYYLSGLIVAGELFKEVFDLVRPLYKLEHQAESSGTILLGTVARDIHDIGKNIFGGALYGVGFTVIDLGVDVPKERFLEEVERSRPQVVCLSGLITPAFESMKGTIDLLHAHAPRLGYSPPVLIGGGAVDGKVCGYVGADSWSTDAMEGVRICRRLVGATA